MSQSEGGSSHGPHSDVSRQRLIEACQEGGITLVLGAGVSLAHGVPTWGRLVERLWGRTFPGEHLPEVNNIPQFLPLALDLISRKLKEEEFTHALKSALYEEVRIPDRPALTEGHGTLAVLARLLFQEFRAGRERRLQRIITFNVDDLVEQATWALAPGRKILKLVARASHHPERGRGAQALPIYHLHGFLPSDSHGQWHQEAPDALVFTDSQYWSSVASPMSFANRVMSFALHDTRCVFLGLSMTDINLLRWLAVRANEIEADKEKQFVGQPEGAAKARRAAKVALDRHFWIRTHSDDHTGFLGQCLALRGIRSVPLESWGSPELGALLAECFPAEPRAPKEEPGEESPPGG